MKLYNFFNILCSIPKTLRFNFHYFPMKIAIKLPVFISKKTYIRELGGRVHLPENISTAMIRIGFGDVGHYDRKRNRGIWQVSGDIFFYGKTTIGHGSKLSIRGELHLGENFNITAESTIICAEKIAFGKDCLVSWENLITDTDEHPIYNNECVKINTNKPIIIGNRVWIGCRCLILKGCEIPDECVVGAGSILCSKYSDKNAILVGNPAAVIKKDITWKH